MSSKFLLPSVAALSALTIVAAVAAPARPAKPAKPAPPRPAAVPAPAVAEKAIGLVLDMDKSAYVVSAAPTRAGAGTAPHIHATLTFFNHSHTPLRLYIGGAATQWQILDAQGKTVWDYSVGRIVPHYIRLVTLVDSQLSYPQDIPLQTQGGAPLAPGRYTLRGAIPGAQAATASLDFIVTR